MMSRPVPYPALPTAIYALALIMAASISSCLDRFLVGILTQPIKHELVLSDVELGLLQGFAFAFVYALFGLPFGRLVDSFNRRNIIVAGLLLWSVATMSAAFAANFQQLFIARLGVGIGEACLAPAAYSLIASLFPPEMRGRALAAFTASLGVGGGASFVIGSAIFAALELAGNLTLPLIGSMSPWRATFFLVSLPGPVLALLMFTFREPLRQPAPVDPARGTDTVALGRYLSSERGPLAVVILSVSFLTMLGTGVTSWAPAVFQRTWGVSVGWIGARMGLLVILASVLGSVVAGPLGDSLALNRRRGRKLLILLYGMIASWPFAIAWPLMPSATSALVIFAIWMSFNFVAVCAAPAVLQDILPDNLRGQVSAMYWLVVGLAGLGLGPSAIAFITQYILSDDARLNVSVTIAGIVINSCMLATVLAGLRTYEAAASRWSGPR